MTFVIDNYSFLIRVEGFNSMFSCVKFGRLLEKENRVILKHFLLI